MATRSMIGGLLPEGGVGALYCHSDGYLEGVGLTLHEHWPTLGHFHQLWELGPLSFLGNNVGYRHALFDAPSGYTGCGAYIRDRGDDGYGLTARYPSGERMLQAFHAGEDLGAAYAYYHDGHHWHICGEDNSNTWVRLDETLRLHGHIAEIVPAIPRPDVIARHRTRTRIPRAINWG